MLETIQYNKRWSGTHVNSYVTPSDRHHEQDQRGACSEDYIIISMMNALWEAGQKLKCSMRSTHQISIANRDKWRVILGFYMHWQSLQDRILWTEHRSRSRTESRAASVGSRPSWVLWGSRRDRVKMEKIMSTSGRELTSPRERIGNQWGLHACRSLRAWQVS